VAVLVAVAGCFVAVAVGVLVAVAGCFVAVAVGGTGVAVAVAVGILVGVAVRAGVRVAREATAAKATSVSTPDRCRRSAASQTPNAGDVTMTPCRWPKMALTRCLEMCG
jgi:hypothetical protein